MQITQITDHFKIKYRLQYGFDSKLQPITFDACVSVYSKSVSFLIINVLFTTPFKLYCLIGNNVQFFVSFLNLIQLAKIGTMF